MTQIGAIDIGNSTTEILIAELGPEGPCPLWDGRIPTSGHKGGEASLRAAADLLGQGESSLGRECEGIALTRLRPVESTTVAPVLAAPSPGIARGLGTPDVQTAAGVGVGSGTLTPLDSLPATADGALIAWVGADVDFEDAARAIDAALRNGLPIVGVLVAGDDAVLIHNRIESSIPIVDEVDLSGATLGADVVVEVARPGEPLSTLGDPIALAASLGLASDQAAGLRDLARGYVDRAAGAVVLLRDVSDPREPEPPAWIELGSTRLPLAPATLRRLAELPVGAATAVRLQGREQVAISDAFGIDLSAVDRAGWVRRGIVDLMSLPLALLVAEGPVDAGGRLEELCGRTVRLVAEETEAALLGGLSTPAAPPGACVLDLGGGTIDAAGEERLTAAGAGSLLTAAVAAALGVARPIAEQIKRGPLVRVSAPQLIHLEDGTRRYLKAPVRPEAVGRLARLEGEEVTTQDLGLAPEEWRGLRLALKEEVLGANVERLLDSLSGALPEAVILAGGAAEDPEVVRIVGERLRLRDVVVGRANVARRYGPRHAVTYGLLRSLAGKAGG